MCDTKCHFWGITDLIGHTPLLELTRIEQEKSLKARVLVKIESLNPARSVKDRVAYALITEAEKNGLIDENTTIIEPTSGNTGVALGMLAISWIDEVMNFIASVYTRLFQMLAVPTIVLAVITTLASLGAQSDSGRIFRTALKYTILTTLSAAAFILVTSLFVMQNGGIALTIPTMLLWLLLSVVSAIGNAGVPMGCFFLTLSLMTGIGAPVAIMGIILPVYTIIDMIETAENVWSDSCVAAMTDHDIKK